MDKYARKGLKKLFSLARTKIRLAREAGTVETRPAPVPLVRILSGREVGTIAECEDHVRLLLESIDPCDGAKTARTVLQLCDIIESVKYGFEPEEDMPQMTDELLCELRDECAAEGSPLRILLLSSEASKHSIYFGEDPPQGVPKFSRVVSGVAVFLRFAYRSDYFSDGIRLRNLEAACGGGSLISRAVCDSLAALGCRNQPDLP